MIRIVESGNSIISGGGGVEEFEWSTSEQVWPFEKDASGNTLYCKEIDFGALPNAGTKNVSHNISGLTIPDIFKCDFFGRMLHFILYMGTLGYLSLWTHRSVPQM